MMMMMMTTTTTTPRMMSCFLFFRRQLLFFPSTDFFFPSTDYFFRRLISFFSVDGLEFPPTDLFFSVDISIFPSTVYPTVRFRAAVQWAGSPRRPGFSHAVLGPAGGSAPLPVGQVSAPSWSPFPRPGGSVPRRRVQSSKKQMLGRAHRCSWDWSPHLRRVSAYVSLVTGCCKGFPPSATALSLDLQQNILK